MLPRLELNCTNPTNEKKNTTLLFKRLWCWADVWVEHQSLTLHLTHLLKRRLTSTICQEATGSLPAGRRTWGFSGGVLRLLPTSQVEPQNKTKLIWVTQNGSDKSGKAGKQIQHKLLYRTVKHKTMEEERWRRKAEEEVHLTQNGPQWAANVLHNINGVQLSKKVKFKVAFSTMLKI